MLEPGRGSDRDEATRVPDPALVESWLRTLPAFEDARVVAVVPLTDGLSNVTCRVEFTHAPVAAAVLQDPAYARNLRALQHPPGGRSTQPPLARTAVPVPGVLASESDARFFGAPFLLLESIDAAHMPAPEARTSPRSRPTFPPSPRRSPRITRSTGGRRDWISSAYRVRPPKGSRARSKPLRGACRRSDAPTSRC